MIVAACTGNRLAPDVRARDLFLPLAIRRGSAILPVDQGVEARKGDRLELVLSERARDDAEAYLREAGWWRAAATDGAATDPSD